MKFSPKTTSTIILVLLVVAIGINYVDRGSLSVTKTDVAAEFNLGPEKMGQLFSAFFWSYALSQIFTGWLVDRLDVKWLYAGGFVLWSVSTILMGLSSGFAMFFLLRLVLGFGESVAYPATSQMIVKNFDERYRGFANALIDAATKLGPAICILLGGLLVDRYGWRSLFFAVGIGGMFWLPLWIWLVPSTKPNPVERKARSAINLGQLLQRREVWGTSIGFFCLGYTWAFLLSWLPGYLEEAHSFDKKTMAVMGSLPLFCMAGTSLFGGWFADSLIRRNLSPTLVRKGFMVGGFLFCALFLMLTMTSSDPNVCVRYLCLACGALGFYTANAWAMTQTLAGSAAAGQWTGFQNAVGNIGGALAPTITGWMLSRTNDYSLPFYTAAGMLIFGVFAYLLLVKRVVPLNWNTQPFSESAA